MKRPAPDTLPIIAIITGGLGLYAMPILRYIVLGLCLGVPGLGLLLLVEAVVGVVTRIHPVRSSVWLRGRDRDDPSLTSRIVTHDLVNAAGASLVLIVTSPLWRPVFGVAAPLWMFVPVAMRFGAIAAMTTFGSQGRVLATVAMVLDAIFTLPLVALLGRSLESVVFVSTTITFLLLIFVAYTGVSPRIADTLERLRPVNAVRLGDWLRTLAKGLQIPLLAAIAAGTAIVAPLAASLTLTGLLLAPFMAAATHEPSPSLERRLVRGLVTSLAGAILVGQLGPAIYRLLLPDGFGDGALVRTLAIGAVACLPLALHRTDAAATERRKALAAAIAVLATVALGVTHGVTGGLHALALTPLVYAVLGVRRSSEREDLL